MNNKIEVSIAQKDPELKKIMERVDPPIINSTNEIFHDLMSCIIEQQIHYRSTKKIFNKALELSNIEILTCDNFYQFEKISLPNIKLSNSKYETLICFLDYWSNNKLDFNALTDEEIFGELSALKGIGRWTIDMILLYTLKRPDVFPFDDFHLKKIMVSTYNLDPKVKLKAQMIEISKNWGQNKSAAVLYLLEWKKQNSLKN